MKIGTNQIFLRNSVCWSLRFPHVHRLQCRYWLDLKTKNTSKTWFSTRQQSQALIHNAHLSPSRYALSVYFPLPDVPRHFRDSEMPWNEIKLEPTQPIAAYLFWWFGTFGSRAVDHVNFRFHSAWAAVAKIVIVLFFFAAFRSIILIWVWIIGVGIFQQCLQPFANFAAITIQVVDFVVTVALILSIFIRLGRFVELHRKWSKFIANISHLTNRSVCPILPSISYSSSDGPTVPAFVRIHLVFDRTEHERLTSRPPERRRHCDFYCCGR